MVRQLRVAQGRVRTYRFLTGEGSAALVKNGQGRTDRAGHRRAIFRITRNSKEIDIASAKLTVWEMYAKATRSKCMLNYWVTHLIINVKNVQISMLRRNTSFRLETIFYQSLEHKI